MYYIYHIPKYQWKNGSFGKIGCTDSLERRITEQGYELSDIEVLEKYDCKYKASDREIKLQKEYGYKVDSIPYWKTLENSKNNKKAVVQFDKKGNKIKEFQTLSECASELKLDISNIHSACTGRYNSCGGFVFRYKGEPIGKIKNSKKERKIKSVIQFDKNNKFIKEWDSMYKAGKELKINTGNICLACNGKLKAAGGFIWKYKK